MLNERQRASLQGIGITEWRHRQVASSVEEAVPTQPDESVSQVAAQVSLIEQPAETVSVEVSANVIEQTVPPADWDQLIPAIQACERCELSTGCTQKVPGVGSRQAELMIIGEGPGMEEDLRGEPFVGRSGRLLDKMLEAIGLQREQVYITNIVKCRPPDNRDPKPAEALACRQYLQKQIELVSPRVILSVGRISAQNLLGVQQPVGKLIQQQHTLPDSSIPLKVSYHPAYLLRTPSAKAIAWNDLKIVHQLLND